MRKQFIATIAGFADLFQDRLQFMQFAALAGGHDLAVPDYTTNGARSMHDFVQRWTEGMRMREQACLENGVESCQRIAARPEYARHFLLEVKA